MSFNVMLHLIGYATEFSVVQGHCMKVFNHEVDSLLSVQTL